MQLDELEAHLASMREADKRVLYSPVCTRCTHISGYRKCRAFGIQAIPVSIWRGDDNHTTPWPCDHGILFEESK